MLTSGQFLRIRRCILGALGFWLGGSFFGGGKMRCGIEGREGWVVCRTIKVNVDETIHCKGII